jgi:hypothetical protein
MTYTRKEPRPAIPCAGIIVDTYEMVHIQYGKVVTVEVTDGPLEGHRVTFTIIGRSLHPKVDDNVSFDVFFTLTSPYIVRSTISVQSFKINP